MYMRGILGLANEDILLESVRALANVIPKIDQLAIDISRLDERLGTVKSLADKHNKALFEGNGYPSIRTQLSDLTQGIKGACESIGELKEQFESLKRDDQEMEKLRRTNRTAIAVSIISAAGTLIAAGIAAAAVAR